MAFYISKAGAAPHSIDDLRRCVLAQLIISRQFAVGVLISCLADIVLRGRIEMMAKRQYHLTKIQA